MLLFSGNLSSNIENKIVLKVENQIITNFEIKNKILTLLVLANEEINQKNINKLKKDVLNTLIDTKIKKIEVSKYKVKKDIAKIESFISRIYTDIPSLKNKFSENNLDYELFFEDLAIQFMWQELIYDIYSKRINSIDYASMNDEISKYIEAASEIKEFKISEIEIEHNKRLYGNTAYSFFDRVILSMKDIFTLVVCVALEKKGVYQIIFESEHKCQLFPSFIDTHKYLYTKTHTYKYKDNYKHVKTYKTQTNIDA